MGNRRLTAAVCMVAMLGAFPAHAGDENMDPETLAQQATLSLNNGDGWNSRDVKRAIQNYGECIARLDKAFAANPSLRTKTDVYSPRVPKWSQEGGGSSGLGATKMVPHAEIRDICVSRLAAAKQVDASESAAADSSVKAQLDRTAKNYADIQKLAAEARAAAKAGKFLKAGSDYSTAKGAMDASIRAFDDALQSAPSIGSAPCAVLPGQPTYAAHLASMRTAVAALNTEWAALGPKIATARTAYDAAIKKGLAGLGGDRKTVLAAHRGSPPGNFRGKVRLHEFDSTAYVAAAGKADWWTYSMSAGGTDCSWTYNFKGNKLVSKQLPISPKCRW